MYHLAQGLAYRPDPTNAERHGFLEPALVMPYGDFQDLLAATRSNWTRVV